MEYLVSYEFWASLLALTGLEIVLGIDNLVFISLVVRSLKAEYRKKAQYIGLGLALMFRILMLLGIGIIIKMTAPFVTISNLVFSGKDLLMLAGGLFLIYKGTSSIREEITGEQKKEYKSITGGLAISIAQITIIDIIFSFDSVITAVGLTTHIETIIIAMSIAIFVMLKSAKFIGDFIHDHPTVKMLALAFVLMVGVFLIGEGFGAHISKGYLYFGMLFSLLVEGLNTVVRKKIPPPY